MINDEESKNTEKSPLIIQHINLSRSYTPTHATQTATPALEATKLSKAVEMGFWLSEHTGSLATLFSLTQQISAVRSELQLSH